MSRNKVIFDVLANSSQYQKEMKGIEKTTEQTSKVIKSSFVVSSAAIGGALKAFADYETRLIAVGKTADLQGKELQDFGKEITNLSTKIPLSTNELLELASSAAQIGVKGRANILKFTETVAKLGTATDIVGEEGTRAIARLLNITGEGIQTVDRFGAVITQLGNNTAATEAEILAVASRIGKSTAQFDLGTTTILGLSAAVKGVGIEAELAGSTIGRTFLEIQNAVFDGGESLNTFSKISGRTGEELKQIFEKDAARAFTIFIESLNKLPAQQVSSAMEDMGLKGVRLREVIGTLAKRSDLLTESLKLASDEAQKQTALNEEFRRAVDSLANSWRFAKNELFNLAKSMGQDLTPAAKEVLEEISGLLKGIKDLNEQTGGMITTSVVMAAKVSALVITFNKLKNILIVTGLVSGQFASQLGVATTATKAFSLNAALGAKTNGIFALSFANVGKASKAALVGLKNFQVGLGGLVGGLVIAIDLGKKLGKMIGKLGEVNTSEQELVKTRETLNTLLKIRNKLEAKAAEGDQSAASRLENLNKEISHHESLIKVLEREVEKRKERNQVSEAPALPVIDAEGGAVDNQQFKSNEEEKTKIFIEEIEMRLAAANREAEIMKGIQQGMSAEAVKLAEDRNDQIAAIDKKKLELDRINQDLSRTGIDKNEQAILQLKRSAIEQELILLNEKFQRTQKKTIEQEAIDMETRIAAKQMLNQALTNEEILFLEEKRARDEENRVLDLETKATQDEEDLTLLQSKLITEQQAKDQFRNDEINRKAAEHNTFLRMEAEFGTAFAKMNKFFNNERVQGLDQTIGNLAQLQRSGNSKMKAIGKAAALVQIGIDTKKGALSAYASLAPIPIVGPALGAAAAAALIAFGAEQAAGVAGFAVGTDFVPQDQLAAIHMGEAIIPAKQNQFLQSGDLVLGSPDTINQDRGGQSVPPEGSAANININFKGASFFGNIVDNDEFTNQMFEAIAIGIDEGRLPGFEQANLRVTS